jgi:hypothetical protein
MVDRLLLTPKVVPLFFALSVLSVQSLHYTID